MTPPRRVNAIALPLGRAALFLLCMLAGLLIAWPAHAQAQAGDPPGRVARLSEADGKVWLYNADGNEWLSIERNRPLTSGDRIATDNGARAEITLGSTTLRLDAATELEIVDLDDSAFHVHLTSGSVAARLRSPQSLAEFGLETDEGRFRVSTVGRYRFDRLDQASELTVYSGQAVFEGRDSALPVTAGQHAQFWLDASGAAQYNTVEPVRDAFAAWNDERDRAGERTVATRFVSPEMTGAADLDSYGGWEQTPDYGPVWTPRGVAGDWAPYSAGRWAWVRPWGWTWVDDAPWGFAPFHYGRWVNYRDRWCWAPGTYVARPVYAPALVAWIGGPRVGVSLTIGGGGPPVGWFPLAPHEVYVPSYRASPGYVRNVNFTHVTNVTIINNTVNNTNGFADHREFQNRRFPNAVTVVPANVLTGRQQVGPAAAQWRGNPQVRALVADSRPGPAMNAAPVATPPMVPRQPEGRAPIRPPFEARQPGVIAGRPGVPDARRGEPGVRPGERSPVPGERGTAPAAPVGVAPPIGVRPGVPPSPVQRSPQVGEMPRPAIAPRPDSSIARPPREPRDVDAARPQRSIESPRGVVEAPRGAEAARRVEAPRGVEQPRSADAPRVAAPQVRPVETTRPAEVPRAAPPEAAHQAVPEARGNHPEAPRRDDKRVDDKRDDKQR